MISIALILSSNRKFLRFCHKTHARPAQELEKNFKKQKFSNAQRVDELNIFDRHSIYFCLFLEAALVGSQKKEMSSAAVSVYSKRVFC